MTNYLFYIKQHEHGWMDLPSKALSMRSCNKPSHRKKLYQFGSREPEHARQGGSNIKSVLGTMTGWIGHDEWRCWMESLDRSNRMGEAPRGDISPVAGPVAPPAMPRTLEWQQPVFCGGHKLVPLPNPCGGGCGCRILLHPFLVLVSESGSFAWYGVSRVPILAQRQPTRAVGSMVALQGTTRERIGSSLVPGRAAMESTQVSSSPPQSGYGSSSRIIRYKISQVSTECVEN